MSVRGLGALRHLLPALLPTQAWQRLSAQAVHALFYLMLLVQPLTGWIFSNAEGVPVVYLGLMPLPNLVDKDKVFGAFVKELHEAGGWGRPRRICPPPPPAV